MWSYWFSSFTPQYQGLPSIGTLESIFNKQQYTKVSGSLVYMAWVWLTIGMAGLEGF